MLFRITSVATLALAATLSLPAPAQNAPTEQKTEQQKAAAAKDDQKDQQKDDQKKSGDVFVVTPTTGITTPAEKLTTLDPKQAEAARKAADDFRAAEQKILTNAKPLRPETRVQLIRGLEAEFVFVRRTFPITKDGLTLKHGELKPDDVKLRELIAEKGVAARPGDRGQITGMAFKGDSIVFELNGGGKKKTKWYNHISIGGAGGETPIAPTDGSMPHGSLLTLAFDKFVPDITVDQVKLLLSPVFDFSSKTAVQAFTETLPPKLKAALDNHQVLVGMNRELVNYAKGRPAQKIREKDETGNEYEEWVYGQPPQEVQFIRFVRDEVTQVKTMTVDGQRIVKTEKEVDMASLQHGPAAASAGTPNGEQQPGGAPADDPNASGNKKPTLRRPGEPVPASNTDNTVTVPVGRPGQQQPIPGAPPPTSGQPPL